jgi:hypothetical protein
MRWIFFHFIPNPSSRTMALGSTPPLTEMSTRNLNWGVKGARRVRLATLPQSLSRLSRKCGSLDVCGPSLAVRGIASQFLISSVCVTSSPTTASCRLFAVARGGPLRVASCYTSGSCEHEGEPSGFMYKVREISRVSEVLSFLRTPVSLGKFIRVYW